MCGIFASEEEREVFENGSDTLRILRYQMHRGPDEQLVRNAAGFTVGLARLAIKDIMAQSARQPYLSAAGNICAFNGEIYNYRALDPTAPSEIALITRMIDEGIDVRQFFDGDYAICHWNPSQRRLTLYRDRFGVCPLYYQTHPKVQVSSERRWLLNGPKEVPAHGRVVIEFDPARIEQDVMPHYGITCGGAPHALEAAMGDADIAATLILGAVRSRALHTDCGFSCTLSGGLDSSAIVLACGVLGLKPQRAICVAAPGQSDDLHYADMIATRAKIDFEVIRVDDNMMREAAGDIMGYLDGPIPIEPLKWRASVRNWFAAKYAPGKVILCGEGADEVIEGYPPHNRHPSPLEVSRHQLTAIKSLPAINLDRTNKLGLAHSKEYRCPFLASTLSYYLMSLAKRPGKQVLRQVMHKWGAPRELLERGKWGSDERFFDASHARIFGGSEVKQ